MDNVQYTVVYSPKVTFVFMGDVGAAGLVLFGLSSATAGWSLHLPGASGHGEVGVTCTGTLTAHCSCRITGLLSLWIISYIHF